MSLAGIWTAKGIDKLAAQTAGGAAVSITRIALGDGGGIVPTVLPSQTALFNEKWRGNVNSVLIEKETPNAVIVEAVIPYTVGGWHIREWALLDNDGDMIAVGPHAEFYKPLLSEGSGAELLERIQLPIANAGQISLTISSDALATRKFAEATATAKAKEEVARHDGDKEAHGGLLGALEVVAEAANAHFSDFNNPHKTPNATLDRYGLVKPDGVTAYITTEGDLLAASPDMPWRPLENYRGPCMRLGSDGNVYLWKKASGPAVAGVGPKDPTATGAHVYWLDYADYLFNRAMDRRVAQYEWFEDDMPRKGYLSCLGGLVPKFAETYPKAAAYFETSYGQKRLVTQAEYDALHVYSWYTSSDGIKVGWNGIGGVAKFVWDKQADTLRLPDLAGMTPEQVGFSDSLGVGGVRGHIQMKLAGKLGSSIVRTSINTTSAPATGPFITSTAYGMNETNQIKNCVDGIDSSLTIPTGPRNHGPRWVSDARVYLGVPLL